MTNKYRQLYWTIIPDNHTGQLYQISIPNNPRDRTTALITFINVLYLPILI